MAPSSRASARMAPAPERLLFRQQCTSLLPSSSRPSSARQQRGSQLVTRAATSADASTVKIIIQGRNVEVTPAIKEYIENKISNAVSSYENVVKEVDVKLKVHGGDATKGAREQVAEVTVYTLRNGVVRVVDKEDNLYASVDKVSDKLGRSLRKLKAKALPKGKWPGHGATVKGGKVISEVLEGEVVDELPLGKQPELPTEVLRTKYFLLEPMNAEEAVDHIQLVDHDFFLYQDKDTGAVQVLYKRNAGGYGVIIPQMKGSN